MKNWRKNKIGKRVKKRADGSCILSIINTNTETRHFAVTKINTVAPYPRIPCEAMTSGFLIKTRYRITYKTSLWLTRRLGELKPKAAAATRKRTAAERNNGKT